SCKKSGKRVVGEKAICLVKQPWLVHLVEQPRLLIEKIFLSTTERTVRRYLGRKRDHAVFNPSTAISDASKRPIDLVEQPTVPKNTNLDTAVPKKLIRRSLSSEKKPTKTCIFQMCQIIRLKCRTSLETAALRTVHVSIWVTN
uniref:BRCT domain-containing protein n=1 Tax=Macrostomum lignano TaxID=282301 RepID=A0A1I8GFE1_9PLAT